MRAAVIENPDPPLAVAKRDQPLAQQHQAQRGAIDVQLGRHTAGSQY